MANYTSTIFATPQEFEEFLNKSKQLTDEEKRFEALKALTPELEAEWNGKAYNMCCTENGKMQLLCKDGNVLAEIDVCHADDDTLVRDSSTGKMTVQGIKDCNSLETYTMWFGTEDEFNAITVKDSKTIYIYTTNFEDEVRSALAKIVSGATVVAKATHAVNAENAENAENATKAVTADDYNTSSGTITNKFTAVDTEIANIKSGSTTVAKASKAGTATLASGYTSNGSINEKFAEVENSISTLNADMSNIKDGTTSVPKATNASNVNGIKIKGTTTNAGIGAETLSPSYTDICFDLYRNIFTGNTTVTASTHTVETIAKTFLVNIASPLFRFITNVGVCYVRGTGGTVTGCIPLGTTYENVNGGTSLYQVTCGVSLSGNEYAFTISKDSDRTVYLYAVDEIVGHPLFG